MTTSSKRGLGCLIAFLIPFFLVGLGGLAAALQGLFAGDLAQAGIAGVFGLIFTGVAVGGLLAGRATAAREEAVQSVRARFPAEPWKWRPEWEAGRIESGGSMMIPSAIFALFWNLISWPAAGAVLKDVRSEPLVLLFLLFPLIGTGLAVWAVREYLRHRKFGVSVFELAHVPGVIGRGLGGLIRTTVSLRPENGFRVRLTCVEKKTTGSGEDQSTSEAVLWEESETVTTLAADPDGPGVMVPVAFRIPVDARPSDDSNSRHVILWRVEAKAEVPGVDYRAVFEVPVFRTEESERAVAEMAAGQISGMEQAPTEPFAQPPESKIRVRHYGRGVEIDFPAARNPGAAFGLTVFVAIWSGFIWLMLALGAPVVFPIILGVIDVLLLMVVVTMWFGVSAVRVSGDSLVVAKGLIVPWRLTTHRAAEFERAFAKRGMQSGSRIYYDLLVAAGGTEVKVASTLRRKREAEWLATVITDALRGTRGAT